MKTKFFLTAIYIFLTLFVSAQKDSGDTLKPYWYYVPQVTFDENCYANGDNWSPDGIYTLPCELIDFQAISNGKKTSFQWSTMSETNASHFNLILIYPDGNEVKSQNIIASGNSNTPRYYKMESSDSYPEGTIVQLTQTDYDGETHLMATEKIDMITQTNSISELRILKNENDISAVWKSDARLSTNVNVYTIDGQLIGIWNGQSQVGMNHSCSFRLEKDSPCIIVLETPYERQTLKTVL